MYSRIRTAPFGYNRHRSGATIDTLRSFHELGALAVEKPSGSLPLYPMGYSLPVANGS